MKSFILILSLLFIVPVMAQDAPKIKFKKKNILVDKIAWGSFEITGDKYFLKTLSGEEYASVDHFRYGTGRYNKSTGEEYTSSYSEVHFFNTDIPLFEVDFGTLKSIVELFVKHKVIDNDKFVEDNALIFKNRYAEEVSQRIFLTK